MYNFSVHSHSVSMATSDHEPIPSCHVVAMPYPGRGHINPMLRLCEAIAGKSRDIVITFVVTEEWLGLIDKPSSQSINFVSIPNVVPSEHLRADDLLGFVTAVLTKMEEPFDRLLDKLPAAAVIIADAILPWAAEVGNRRSIPVAYLWSMSASVYTLLYHLDLLVKKGHFPVDLASANEDAIVDYIPGLPPILITDLPTIMTDQQQARFFLSVLPQQLKSNFLIFSTFHALESQVLNALTQTSLFSIFNIAPNLTSHSTDDEDTDLISNWLDHRPPRSVLYISLGSFLHVSEAQTDEIAYGLHSSGVSFLWVARRETNRLQSMCEESKGMVVPWCDQWRVLSHSSVGGFWSHCGWNSTKEAVMAGVPVLASPILMDQVTNAKAIVEDWRIGWRVGKGVFGEDGLVKRDEICELVGRFMDLKNPDREELSENARKLKSNCEVEFQEGQSFEADIEGFVQSIKKNVQC